jgi:RND superfamily putative drug exporter
VRVERAVAATPGVIGSTRPQFIPSSTPGRPGVALARVYPKGSPQDASTSDLLHTVRNTVVSAAERETGLHVLVGGQTAIFDDFATVLSRKLPLFLTIVIGLSFLLLMAVFRSVVIPAIAAAMNLLSAAAAFGVMTAVLQDGSASLLGIDKTGPIEAFVPVFLFAIPFAFILGGERVIDLFGVGLATAVLLDALIVRSVLVPALMLLIADANWWLPAWLDRLLPHLRVEGATARATPSHARAPDRAVAEPVAS